MFVRVCMMLKNIQMENILAQLYCSHFRSVLVNQKKNHINFEWFSAINMFTLFYAVYSFKKYNRPWLIITKRCLKPFQNQYKNSGTVNTNSDEKKHRP